jgi:type III pantothenate kinase
MAAMNLTIDIGNTRVKLGLFEEGRMVRQEVWEAWTFEKLLVWLTNQMVKNVILCNVVGEVPSSVQSYLGDHYFYMELRETTPLPIENLYSTPATLGKDRLAAIVGAFQLFPKENCLVIDAGTCITYDLLDEQGRFLGGNISPGIRMRLRAMHTFTAGLPLAPLAKTPSWVGKTTVAALQNGAQRGALLEMEGFIDHFRAVYGQGKVILTGGDADFFAKKLKSEIFVNHHLVLLGLNKILTYNVQRL